jgi:hypothetical protein
MNELIIKSFLLNTYSLICLLPEEIKKISSSSNKFSNYALFDKTMEDIKDFSPLFTKEALDTSLNNVKNLNNNECQIYLSALEDKFKNITKASEIVSKEDESFINRVEIQKEDLSLINLNKNQSFMAISKSSGSFTGRLSNAIFASVLPWSADR